jgi:2-hydroxy-6-oxonona-2,4-dienedioate hydrolase
LVWGKEDQITPAFVGEKFHELLPDSRLFLLDECGHAPMMEHPQLFNRHLEEFLQEVSAPKMLV